MTQSNLHPYSLPLPSDVLRTQISSYSSLANALGTLVTDPGRASRQRRGPLLTNCDAITDTHATYLNTPSVTYSDPARNVSGPGTYRPGAPLSVSNGGCPSDTSVMGVDKGDGEDLSRFPPWYNRLPQPFFVEAVHGHQVGSEFPAVRFLRKENKDPYSVWDLLTMDTMPDLVTGSLPILVQSPDRWIKIKWIWPGYSRYPFEKRIPIKRGAPLTPNLLLMTLAHHIDEYARWIQSEGAVVEPGQEYWTVTEIPLGPPPTWKDCIITSLQHRAGSVWQPKIYYPR